MPLKQLILHTVRHLETITAISSLIGISSKVLLSGRWQKKKKNTECTTWPFFTCLLKHLGSLKNWHIPRLQPKDWSLLRMSILYSHPNEWASAKKQALHWWGKTSQFHISGWRGRMGKTTLGGTQKKSSSTYFLKSNLKACQIAWTLTCIYQSKILLHCPHWNTVMVNTICQLSAPTFPLLR